MSLSIEQKEWMIKNYDNFTLDEIAKKFKTSRPVIANNAKMLKLKKDYYKSKLNKLLNDSLESFYWVGFLLADGYFSEKYIVLNIANIDRTHLEKYSKFIESKTAITEVLQTCGYSKGKIYVSITNGGKKIIAELRRKFDIHHKKSTNPPNFSKYNFSEIQFLSLFIGFIDGDGCIHDRGRKGKTIQIKLHASWNNNLEFLNSYTHNFFQIPITTTVKTKEYSILSFYKKELLKKLKDFTIKHNLPVLDRKWSKL